MTDVALFGHLAPSGVFILQAERTALSQRITKFQVTQAGWLKDLAWWQIQADQTPPNRLSLYEDGVGIYTTTVVPSGGTVPGWQRVAVTDVVPLATGKTYAVSVTQQIGSDPSIGDPSDRGVAGVPFILDDGMRWNSASDYPTYPTSAGSDYFPPGDCTWTDVDPGEPEPPPPEGDLAAELALWFDTVLATKPGAEPGLYPMAAAEIIAVPAGGATRILPRTLAAVLTVIDAVADLTAIAEIIRGWLDPAPGGTESAVRRPDGTTVMDDTQALIVGQNALEAQLNTMQAQLTTIQDMLEGQAGDIGAFPTGWVLLDEQPWTGSIAYNEPAHLYVVDVTSPSAHGGQVDVEGILWLPRLGWWAELNATQVGARGFLEFGTQQLHAGGRAMAGCLLKAKPDAMGTIQAWGAP